METLTFELKLLNGPNSPVVLVAGGADGDRDGTIEDAGEVEVFRPAAGNLWRRTQQVQTPTADMLFCVTFVIGVGVRWELKIKNSAGTELFSSANTTAFTTENVSFFLS